MGLTDALLVSILSPASRVSLVLNKTLPLPLTVSSAVLLMQRLSSPGLSLQLSPPASSHPTHLLQTASCKTSLPASFPGSSAERLIHFKEKLPDVSVISDLYLAGRRTRKNNKNEGRGAGLRDDKTRSLRGFRKRETNSHRCYKIKREAKMCTTTENQSQTNVLTSGLQGVLRTQPETETEMSLQRIRVC